MTRQLRQYDAENPRGGKILVVFFSLLLGLLTISSAGQLWLYQQQREDMKTAVSDQEKKILEQKTRIDSLQFNQESERKRVEDLAAENGRQDVRMSKEYVSLDRYAWDLADLKKAIDKGFSSVERRIEILHSKH